MKMDKSNLNSPNSPTKNFSESDYQLEDEVWSLEQLKVAAVEQRLLRPRSLAWAILLYALPPPDGDIIDCIRSHRDFYNDLKVKLCMDPRTVVGDDPLSQNDESAWRQHFCDNELKTMILQDVVRTFPDELYFREKDVQDLMVGVLFYWARSHSSIGYRQGMHEILAPLLFELYLDRKLAPSDICDKLKYILDEDFLEHDSFMLFSSVMKGLERYYTTGEAVPNSCGRLPPSRTVHNPNEVVRYLDKVKEDYLVPLDPELATHLANCNISMELFGIRWLRLLFGREFSRSEVPHLWGFLFAEGPTLPHLHYVIVAMLISMRKNLLSCDGGGALCTLMRPSRSCVQYVTSLSRHLRAPERHPRPRTPPDFVTRQSLAEEALENGGMEIQGSTTDSSSSSSTGIGEGVAEGADVARELAALAVLRARLPRAVAALQAALPRAPPNVQQPLNQILQLSALLQCRNHALIDVETALEAAENQNLDRVGRRRLVPVVMNHRQQTDRQKYAPQVNRVKEVPLKVFHQVECNSASDLPCLDPLRIRTE